MYKKCIFLVFNEFMYLYPFCKRQIIIYLFNKNFCYNMKFLIHNIHKNSERHKIKIIMLIEVYYLKTIPS